MEELNPYRAPSLIDADNSGSSTLRVLLRIGAVCCWLLSGTWLVIMILLLLDEPAPVAFQHGPYAFVVMFLTTFVSPAIGMTLIGLAAWRRSLRFAVYGGALFIPLGVFAVIRNFY